MKKIVLLTICFIAGSWFFNALHAQTSVNSAGGEATGSGGSASYSIGQLFTRMSSSSTGSVVEGIQQPYEIWIYTGIEEIDFSLYLSAYPNPVNDILTLKNSGSVPASYQLIDSEGKVLKTHAINTETTCIDMQSLSPAVYFLRVSRNHKQVKTFKIIKH